MRTQYFAFSMNISINYIIHTIQPFFNKNLVGKAFWIQIDDNALKFQ